VAERRTAVRDHTPHAVVYTLSEIGNLLAVCSPALCVGVAGILLAVKGAMPRGLRMFTIVAGVCGVLAPFYFTYFVFVLWTVVAGIAFAASRRPAPVVATLQESLA